VDTNEKNNPVIKRVITIDRINLSKFFPPLIKVKKTKKFTNHKYFVISLLKYLPRSSKFLKLSNEAAEGLNKITFF
jgi:hypothetical protein